MEVNYFTVLYWFCHTSETPKMKRPQVVFQNGRLDPALTPVLSTGTHPGKRNPSYLFNRLLLSGFPQCLGGKELTCQCKRHRFNPWVGNIPQGGNGNPFQYSCLDNLMDRGPWWATLHGVAKGVRHDLETKQQVLSRAW